MDLVAIKDGVAVSKMRVMSVGGGDIEIEGRTSSPLLEIYKEKSFAEIAEYCKHEGIRISDFVIMHEGREEIFAFLAKVWDTMKDAIHRGRTTSGILPGGLEVERKAQYLYNQRHIDERQVTRENRLVCSYAFAVSEENADNGTIVTAPTCGACAVLPAVLKYMEEKNSFSESDIIRALAVAGEAPLLGVVPAQEAPHLVGVIRRQIDVGLAAEAVGAEISSHGVFPFTGR